MIIRSYQRLVPVLAAVIIFSIVLLKIYDVNPLDSIDSASALRNVNLPFSGSDGKHRHKPSKPDGKADVSKTHREIFSLSGKNGFYFPIVFGEQQAINPNIIPHPHLNDTWIIVAQDLKDHRYSPDSSVFFTELVCSAQFKNGALRCLHEPIILPIANSFQPEDNACMHDPALGLLSLNIGPHDARVFMGPDNPFAVWGSNSRFVCMGMFMQDFRMLFDWGFEPTSAQKFLHATELQRPPPSRALEKNYFPFWDFRGDIYVHFDMAPARSFAKLELDGSVGPNLAPRSESLDKQCISAFFPPATAQGEAIHQATNSLSITMCARGTCTPDATNTYILSIFQHKSHNGFHAVYSPYLALFQQTAPFTLHAVSSKPFWIHGAATQGRGRIPHHQAEDIKANWSETEMIYVTSMSWKSREQKYHGYRDDVVFLGFGIEDEDTAGVDFVIADLLDDLSLCANAHADNAVGGLGHQDLSGDVPGLAVGGI